MYCGWCIKFSEIADSTPIAKGTDTLHYDTLKSHSKSEKHGMCWGRVQAEQKPDNVPLKVGVCKQAYASKIDKVTEDSC